MKVKIDLTKSAQDNAKDYFDKAKKARHKKAGAQATIKDLEKRVKERQESNYEKEQKSTIKEIAKKEWYEKFRWFFTSEGLLAIGGKDAMQNETLNSKYFDDTDLFFHADVFGASVIILKGGKSAGEQSKMEVAQFAACHSRAWEQGSAVTNVYAMRREQVSKSKQKGSLGTGSFLLEGEREWYRNTSLEMCAFERKIEPEGKTYIAITPSLTCKSINAKKFLSVRIGNSKKSDAAKKIANFFKSPDIDSIMQSLPSGKFNVSSKQI